MHPCRWPRIVRLWISSVLFPLLPIASLAARAENYNFNKDDGGWTSPDPAPNWIYGQLPANEKSWKAFCPGEVAASVLLSPCFEIGEKSIDVDFGHRFRFQDNPAGKLPAGAGQVQFSLNDSGTWLGISTWSSQGAELAPTFTPSSPATIPPLVAPGLAFVGTSPKYFNSPNGGGNFNESSFQLANLTPGDEIRFRFVAAMFGPACPSCMPAGGGKGKPPCDPGMNPLWDLNRFHIKGAKEIVCVPEPSGLALAAAGGAAAALLARRRRVSGAAWAGFMRGT